MTLREKIHAWIIPEWREVWKWYSVWGKAAAFALLACWALLPEEMQKAFSPQELKYMAMGLIVLAFGGQLVKQ